MKKIASHIGSQAKFSKASKLAVQLIQAGSVKPSNNDYFFSILESAMSCPTACTDQLVRADYHALFSTAQDVADVSTWLLLCCVDFEVLFEATVSPK